MDGIDAGDSHSRGAVDEGGAAGPRLRNWRLGRTFFYNSICISVAAVPRRLAERHFTVNFISAQSQCAAVASWQRVGSPEDCRSALTGKAVKRETSAT